MLLILARHGNTFEAGDKLTWVGARTDLPLTAKGKEQAAALASALEPIKTRLWRIIAGPLKRTREHAQFAASLLGLEAIVEIDRRLLEIDYGLWEGKTSEEIQASGGAIELEAWNSRSIWPTSPGWAPAEAMIVESVTGLAAGLVQASANSERFEGAREKAVLLVTSNGVLRYFLKLVPGAFNRMALAGSLKVATGNCCALRHGASGWELIFWNREPAGNPLG